MSSAVFLSLLSYVAVITFVAAVAYRFRKIASMPLHLRWELYPVAHEAGDKARYGGSQLEELDWWTKEKHSSLANELRYMIPEMLFLVALYEHNRKMWWRSFPFHFGLYLLIGLIGLLGLGSVLELLGVEIGPAGSASVFGAIMYYLTQLVALAGLTLAMVGAVGLLQQRLTDPDLKDYTTAGHVFNLAFFVLTLAVAWLTFIFADTGFVLTRDFIKNLITFNIGAGIGSSLLGLEIFLAVLLIAYIPLTHMSHFFLKWFTYHKVRWDDEANQVGSIIEKKIVEQCGYPVTWAAPHLKADGKKNWVDIATEEID